MKVLDAEQLCAHYVRSLLRSAYSDTAALTSCNRRSQYVKSWTAANSIKFFLSLVTVILH